MNIRPMTFDDYDAVFALWQGTPGLGLRQFDDSLEGVTRFLRRNPETSFVAVENGEVAGVILCGHDCRRAHIYHVAVRADMQRRGVGTALVAAVVEALRKENIHKASLTAFADNEAGNRFWDKAGFHRRDDLFYRDRVITGEEELAAILDAGNRTP
ncbi:GNAT family N-acetyltransferase [Desulfovibrio sp. OttesenSCG-928-O18]|nr:GNAT family N-acetyltransferase [Desulfovibrio sp. OttesenSCG-928-O18]